MLHKLNLGCGDNRLPGWDNHDADVDISKPLPFSNGQIDFILCEHCMEHIEYYEAIEFLKECRRILKSTGIVRIIVPSIEQIWKRGDLEYFQFTRRWQQVGSDARAAMHAILYAHGHETAWTESLLEATMFYCGFNRLEHCQPHQSKHAELRNVDGHHKMIGEKFNMIESLIIEGTA